jgi:glycosyltransferase involved in cell wall biosynthesis
MSCYASGPAPLKVKIPGFAKQANRVRRYLGFHDILNSADARIGMSRLVAGMFREQRNTHAVYPGIDLQAYQRVEADEFKQALGIQGEYVLVPGRINPIKGQMDALHALKYMPQDVTIVFAGNVALDPRTRTETGPFGVALAKEAERLGLRKRVVFTGMLTQPQMAAAYSGAAVTLVPSVWAEPFGYVVAESMACGTPVVITSNCGAAELVDESVGQKVPRRDPEAMAMAVGRAMERREAMGRAARQLVEERLAWPVVAAQVVNVLEQAVARRKARAAAQAGAA